jgi:hypothetical protein
MNSNGFKSIEERVSEKERWWQKNIHMLTVSHVKELKKKLLKIETQIFVRIRKTYISRVLLYNFLNLNVISAYNLIKNDFIHLNLFSQNH